jgi:hypothetical protein
MMRAAQSQADPSPEHITTNYVYGRESRDASRQTYQYKHPLTSFFGIAPTTANLAKIKDNPELLKKAKASLK